MQGWRLSCVGASDRGCALRKEMAIELLRTESALSAMISVCWRRERQREGLARHGIDMLSTEMCPKAPLLVVGRE